MYAVVRTGGRQYRAQAGGQILVDRLPAEVGQRITLDEVLLVASDEDVQVGAPLVKGAKVTATVVAQEKGKKVFVFRYIPKERYRRRGGHRAQYTRLRIDEIVL